MADEIKLIKVGFTGTQQGLSELQKIALIEVAINLFKLSRIEFHHGDCIGADAEAHNIMRKFGAKIIIHPPMKSYKRAYCHGDIILNTKEYLVRNKDIIEAAEILIATPNGPEKIRSGTWATVRHARKNYKKSKNYKKICIIYPDGLIKKENFNYVEND